MASTTSRQPPWTSPSGTSIQPNLKVYNSLTRSKVPFIPLEHDRITWYACGPTVYDDAHLGHARNYVSTDIIRRILRDYFKFKVNFVMNITDVDDKIILRGRQRFLYDGYKKKHRYIDDSVRQDVREAWKAYINENLPRIFKENPYPALESFHTEVDAFYGDIIRGQPLEPGTKAGDKEAKVKMHINTAMSTVKALTADPKTLTPDAFYSLVNDVMCEQLDKKFGNTIRGTDHAVFTALTKEYEDRFFRDMQDLNVMDPDVIVRVTESGKEIADFVDKIVNNKFAYATKEGSVYFDINAFEAAGHPYARLEPENKGNAVLVADGEGKLTQKSKEKRSGADFALWKASRPGEPSWDSPWGPGRPGWHIECSAMASAKIGKQMDIHSGGIDLAFPHHDNELAQSEAYWTEGHSTQWVNYFLHMGHLSIQGSKMSKSLKNYTAIRTALERRDWTSRSLRIVFLLGNWRDGIEITDDVVKESSNWEDRVDNFFINAIEAITTCKADSDAAPVIANEIAATKQKVNEALLDSFNTRIVMAAISELINTYNSTERSKLTLSDHTDSASFVSYMVNVFGLNGNEPPTSSVLGWRGIEIPEEAKAHVYPLAEIRDQLRQAAIAKSITPEKIQEIISTVPEAEEEARLSRPRPSYARALNDFKTSATQTASDSAHQSSDINKQILALCDRVRDVDLWNLNIYLEDRENKPALVRPVTEGLRAARREKEEKARLKEEAKAKREEDNRQRLLKGRVPPQNMYKPPTSDEFSAWDSDGMPTTMKDGTPVTASRIKKLRKNWDQQKKAHEAFQAAVKQGIIVA